MNPKPSTLEHNPAQTRWEAQTDAGMALLSYTEKNGRLHLTHTEVPEAAEGEGIGSSLVRAALEDARAKGLKVVPDCPFVGSYLKRHPEYQELVATS